MYATFLCAEPLCYCVFYPRQRRARTLKKHFRFSSRVVAMIHALRYLVCFALYACVANHCLTVRKLSAVGLSANALHESGAACNVLKANTPAQIELACGSLAYFSVDLCYLLLCEPSVTYAVHHALSIGFLLASLRTNRYGSYVALGLLLGEATNPLHILWSAAREYRLNNAQARLSPVFTYAFVGARCVAIPLACAHLVRQLSSAGPRVSFGERALVGGLACAFVAGGVHWAHRLWRGYCRFQHKPARAQS